MGQSSAGLHPVQLGAKGQYPDNLGTLTDQKIRYKAAIESKGGWAGFSVLHRVLHTCQVSMCTCYFISTPLSPCYTHVKSRCVLFFKSTPLSPCYTHVKSRCALVILNPPPFQFISISSEEETLHLHQLWVRMKRWSEENLCWAAFGTRWRVACVECTRFMVFTCLLFV